MFDPTRLFFTADHHFGHRNILKYTRRPFPSVEAMDAELIQRWNATVSPGDNVFHLGDFALNQPNRALEILDQLHGNIHLIQGNHDSTATHPRVRERFVWIKDLYSLKVHDPDLPRGRVIVLCHYAMRVWDGSFHGTWHLYGHSHGELPDDPHSLSFDAGVDCHDFRPISFGDVAAIMARKDPRPENAPRAS